MDFSTLGKRGTWVIPKALRERFNLKEGSLLAAEATDGGILLRPAAAAPIEVYDPRRKAELLLNNAVDERDYKDACAAVRDLGLDPADIQHSKPHAQRRAGRRR